MTPKCLSLYFQFFNPLVSLIASSFYQNKPVIFNFSFNLVLIDLYDIGNLELGNWANMYYKLPKCDIISNQSIYFVYKMTRI